jgi:hypothetical protein
MRTATLAHRAEIMDDHMTDSNHKKMLGMGGIIVERYLQAAETSQIAQKYYNNLVQGIDPIDQNEWERQIQNAELTRLQDRTVMDILGAKQLVTDTVAAAASADITSRDSSITDWIQLAIEIEECQ